MRRASKRPWQSALTVTIALILLMTVSSFLITNQINQMEEARCFQRLEEEAAHLARDIEASVKSDREQLELLAAAASRYRDLSSPGLWEVLRAYDKAGILSRIELLLPDGTVLVDGGRPLEAEGLPSFEEEAALGAHICDREPDPTAPGKYIARNYVPVVRDGETVAMLCGVVEWGALPEELLATPYGGEAAIYVIDGATGYYLVDTWHNDPEANVWTMGGRSMAKGYDDAQLRQGLIDGETNYVVFVSRTIGQYLYFYYQPLSVNQWRLALSVPEDVVFESSNAIRAALNRFLGFEALCFILYFLWMLRYVRRETSQKQRQLDRINYVYDVERLLFNAHEKQEHLAAALEKVAHITSAGQVCLWTPQEQGGASFLWRQGAFQAPDEETALLGSRLLEYFRTGEADVAVRGPEEARALLPPETPVPEGGMMAVPIPGRTGGLWGVLFACGVPARQVDVSLLGSVCISFSMFEQNRRMHDAVRQRGEQDVLSGLYNRNRFEADIPQYPARCRTSLACAYIDVNGLHELNNQEGHEAGDQMIQTTAQVLAELFGAEYCYRIGGDEFVAFVPDEEEAQVHQMGQAAEQRLAEQGIYISVGIQWQRNPASIDELLKGAEKRMYAAKRAFYADPIRDRRGARRQGEQPSGAPA